MEVPSSAFSAPKEQLVKERPSTVYLVCLDLSLIKTKRNANLAKRVSLMQSTKESAKSVPNLLSLAATWPTPQFMMSMASESRAMLALTVSLTPNSTSNQPISSIVPDISQRAISAAKNNGLKVATCALDRALLVQSVMCSTLRRIRRMKKTYPIWMRMKIGKTKNGMMRTGRST